MDKNNNLTQTNNPSINNNKTTSTMNSDLEKITNELNNLKGAELEKRLFYYTKSFNNYNEEIVLQQLELESLYKLLEPYYKKINALTLIEQIAQLERITTAKELAAGINRVKDNLNFTIIEHGMDKIDMFVYNYLLEQLNERLVKLRTVEPLPF